MELLPESDTNICLLRGLICSPLVLQQVESGPPIFPIVKRFRIFCLFQLSRLKGFTGQSCRHRLLQILKVLLVPLRQEHVVEQSRGHVGRHLTMRTEARRHRFLVVDGSFKDLDQAFSANLVIASRPGE